MRIFRQAVQNIIPCDVGLARLGRTFTLLGLAGKTEPVSWPRGCLRIRTQMYLSPMLSRLCLDLGIAVLSRPWIRTDATFRRMPTSGLSASSSKFRKIDVSKPPSFFLFNNEEHETR